ncbi:hypothetical protein [Paraburkholderia steynii]|uniref:hypothetical protein n=1 Tax=Paraburkholderia steynii TaxID=1245441 RepID=UPI00115F8CE4|nr:hypothetical protein [Paraburkholderia steynii]
MHLVRSFIFPTSIYCKLRDTKSGNHDGFEAPLTRRSSIEKFGHVLARLAKREIASWLVDSSSLPLSNITTSLLQSTVASPKALQQSAPAHPLATGYVATIFRWARR